MGPLLALPTAAMHSALRTLYEIFSQRKRPTVGIALSRLTICEKKEGQKSEHLCQGTAPVPALASPCGAQLLCSASCCEHLTEIFSSLVCTSSSSQTLRMY